MSHVDVNRLSAFNVFWLLHVFLELPVAMLAYIHPYAFPLANVTESTVLIMKLLATFILTSCVGCLLCFMLPDYLPGKRALALQLFLFHGIVAILFWLLPPGIVLYKLPVFVLNLFPLLEQVPNTVFIGSAHAVVSFVGVCWWQATIPTVQALTARLKTE